MGFRPGTTTATHAALPDVAPAQHHDPVNDHLQQHADAQHTDGPNSKPGHAHPHAATTGQTVNDHHNRDHHATHEPGGADVLAARYAEVKIVAAQNIPANAFTKVLFDAVVQQDAGNPFSIVTSLYTCPVAGLYVVTSLVSFAAAINSANCLATIYRNGAEAFRGEQHGSANVFALTVDKVLRCAAGDTLGVYVFKDTAGNTALQVNSPTQSYANFEFIGA